MKSAQPKPGTKPSTKRKKRAMLESILKKTSVRGDIKNLTKALFAQQQHLANVDRMLTAVDEIVEEFDKRIGALEGPIVEHGVEVTDESNT